MIYHHIRQKKNNIPKYSEFSSEPGEKGIPLYFIFNGLL